MAISARMILAFMALCVVAALPVDVSKSLSRLSFGSCNKHDGNPDFWPRIAATNPDVFVWLGDIVYTDAKVIWKWRIPANGTKVRHYFELQKAIPQYAKFAAQVPITGVYDDHDLGMNDADRTFSPETRLAAQSALLDFLDDPIDSVRRSRNGVFVHYVFGAAPRRVRLILLDNRSFRDPYDDDKLQDMMGPEQWQWLEDVLTSTDAEITIIGAGLQIVARGDPWVAESWSKLPQSQAKLISLLARTNTTGALFISGDMHISEINKMTCGALGYPLWDFTASGMTHSWGGWIVAPLWRLIIMAATRVPNGLYTEKHWSDLQFHWAEKELCDAAGHCSTVNDPARTMVEFSTYAVETGKRVLHQNVVLASLSYRGQAGLDVQQSMDCSKINSSVSLDDPWHSQQSLSEDELRIAACNQRAASSQAPLEDYPLMVNGLPFHRSSGLSLAGAIAKCAAEPLNEGFSDACATVMNTCYPKFTLGDSAYYYGGHAAVLTIVWSVIGVAVYFAYLTCARPKAFPGPASFWQALGVLLVAAIFGLIRALI